ncbi:MAG: RtcB family protein [Campylobacter sp.]|nr:RtcB family protein [Campylobacter sp.]
MFELTGKYGTAKVYATTVEDECVSQIYGFMNSPVVEGCNIAIMPDTHAGKGSCIGFTQKINGRVNPNMVGVDIGCGMLVLKISKEAGDIIFNKPGLDKFDKIMHTKVPSGMDHRKTLHKFAKEIDITKLIADADYSKELFAIGSLGGGNHFVEIDKDEAGDYYIVIHSGSRYLGIAVAKYWEDKAVEYHKNNSKAKNDLINKLKREGREKDIQTELAKIPTVVVSKELSYLEGEDLNGYLHDMEIAQEFARLNREAMLDVLVEEMGIKKRHILGKFCTIHNYIDIKNGILRKGAISLMDGEEAIIPINMQFGSLIVKGKGNPDWNYSGPHGAGRLMSRSKAKETLKMEDFKAAMKDIYTTSVCVSTIDEAPMAYKPADEILENIKENAEILSIIKPIYNFKAAE